MRIAKTEKGWSIEVPANVAANLQLRDGEDVEVDIQRMPALPASEEGGLAARAIRSLAGSFPADFKFDRDEANARH